MRILELYKDYSIQHVTEGNKHCAKGWVQIHCPFCTGSQNYHLGYNMELNYFVCWRCGGHKVDTVLKTILKINHNAVKNLISDYGGIKKRNIIKEAPTIKLKLHPLKYPTQTNPIERSHVSYLLKRKFDPDLIVRTWQVLGTGPVSTLKTKDKILDYRHRIIIPIFWDKKVVTFQTRDVTNKHPFKYLACPKEREEMHHKHILYMHPEFTGEVCIISEGVTDVWRLGKQSAATFGLEYTPQQLKLIAKLFKRVPVMFDGGEPQAVKKANILVADLKFRGVDAFRVDIVGDPGGMDQGDADYLVKQLVK